MGSGIGAGTLNVFDAIVIGILGLSTLVAFFRGFIRELLSLGAWVGAAIITIYLFPHSTDALKTHMKNEHMAAGVGALGTYLAALIFISIINSIIMRYVKTGLEVGILDNFLGLLFGAARGVFIVSLGFLIMTSFVSKDNPPEWLKTSVTKDELKKGADVLVSVAPKYLNDLEVMVKNEADKEKNNQNTTGSTTGTVPQTSIDTGYKSQSQSDLGRMIDSNSPAPATGTTLHNY